MYCLKTVVSLGLQLIYELFVKPRGFLAWSGEGRLLCCVSEAPLVRQDVEG